MKKILIINDIGAIYCISKDLKIYWSFFSTFECWGGTSILILRFYKIHFVITIQIDPSHIVFLLLVFL